MTNSPRVYVNGAEVSYSFGKTPVWPKNRFIRYVHRRILKRPPLGYTPNRSVVVLDTPPPAGTVVFISYPVDL